MLAKFIDTLFLPGHTPAEGVVEIYYQENGTRVQLRLPLLEAMLLLQQLEEARVRAKIDPPNR